MSRTLSNKLQGVDEATRRAQSFPVLLCHGKGNSISVCVCVCARACFRDRACVMGLSSSELEV